jgi:uncharacterized membrane protein YphA (DoxX/SURF4 family)
MSAVTLTAPDRVEADASESLIDHIKRDPAYQAFWLLRIGFTAAPILFGLDKFANLLVNWEAYLAPWIRHLSPLSATHTMNVVGVIEVIAGVLVALKPRYAAYIVAAWLGGIIVDLLTYSGYYDVALRDFGLLLGALTLGLLPRLRG